MDLRDCIAFFDCGPYDKYTIMVWDSTDHPVSPSYDVIIYDNDDPENEEFVPPVKVFKVQDYRNSGYAQRAALAFARIAAERITLKGRIPEEVEEDMDD